MRMKFYKFNWAIVVFAISSIAVADELKMKDLAPKREDPSKVQQRIDDQNMKRIYEEEKAKNRPKSQAEQEIDKIPKKTTVRPTYPPGVQVTIPTK